MNLFKKLFGKKETEFTPDNTQLWQLLQQYNANRSQEHFIAVYTALQSDHSYLIVPTFNDDNTPKDEWYTAKKGDVLQFTTVYDIEGLKVFGVFSSPEALATWAKKEMTYTLMSSKVVLEIAEQQQFGRIVIDSDLDTMYVLERDVSNITTEVVQKETTVLIWTPKKPIGGKQKECLVAQFKKNENILSVYHFGMTKNEEMILILAVELEQETENGRLGFLSTLNDGMSGFTLDLPLDIMYINPEHSLYETAKQHECFYFK